METIQYEFNLSDQRLRRRRLRQAVLAFISAAKESSTSLHAIGLVVPVPSLSTTPFGLATPSNPAAVATTVTTEKTDSTTPATPKRSAKRAADSVAPKATSDKKAAKVPSRKTQLMRWRQHQREAARRACYATTEARLAQARHDACDLQRWLHTLLHTLGLRELNVLVIAALQPRTVKDLAFFRLWQLGSEAARASPLRLADLISLSFASEKLLVAWSARYEDGDQESKAVKQRRKTKKTRAGPPPRFELESLLLPHQSLLLDVSWCVEAGLRRVPESALHAQRRPHKSQDAHLPQLTLVELFLSEILPTLVFPKGGTRSAGWLAYHRWLPLYSEALHEEIKYQNARYTHHDNNNIGDDDGGTGAAAGASSPSRVVSLAECCAHMRQLYHAFYGHPRAVGHRLAWRLCVGYGGSVASLLEPAQLVLVDHASLARPSRSASRSGPTQRGSSPSSPSASASKRAPVRQWCAGLLSVRGLRDVYATLATLVAQDQTDLYSAALTVHRAMCRRLFLAGHLLHGVPPLERLLMTAPKSALAIDKRCARHGRGRRAKKAAKKATSCERGVKRHALKKPTSAGTVAIEGDTVATKPSLGPPPPTKALSPSTATTTTTTLSRLMRRGRRTLMQRRRALLAIPVRSKAATGRAKGLTASAKTAKQASKRDRGSATEAAAVSSPPAKTRKARRVEAEAVPLAVERVAPTTLDDTGMGWVEDV